MENENKEEIKETLQEEVKAVAEKESPKEDVRPPYTGDKGMWSGQLPRDTPVETKTVATYSCGHRVRVAALNTSSYEEMIDHNIQVAGWARTIRMGGKDFCFIELNDGSCQTSLQVVVDSTMPNFAEVSHQATGASFKAVGKLIRSPAKGQLVELQVCCPINHKIKVIGECPGDSYYLAKKKHSNEYLRDIAHMRGRTKTISAVMRIRNNLAYATHRFFQERGFQYIHTPIITASDCEGAGEMFQVTTTMPSANEPISKVPMYEYVGQENEEKKEPEKKQNKKDKKKAKKNAEGAEEAEVAVEAPKEMIPPQDRKVNYKEDFFGRPAYLTVSGQLNVETYACGMGDVYTFGPTFRAENSNTSRHLAEFWMIEPELVFADLDDLMDCAEDYTKFCVRYVLENNKDDIAFFNQWVDKELMERLDQLAKVAFKRLTYTEGIDILTQHLAEKKVKFERKPVWGTDLGSEHERYLAEKVFKQPVIVYNYPKEFKAFYMKMNEDGKTVQAMDMLVPGIGELIGGSTREENLDKLDAMIAEKKLIKEDYWWYRELRKFGTNPHGGFGLGFERLVMLCTGIENIRDTIPFPRTPKKADF